GDVEVDEEVGHEQRVLVHRADGGQDSLKAPLPLAKDGEVEGHVPQRDLGPSRAAGDQQVASVERRQREQAERKSPEHAAYREPTILVKELLEERTVSAQHQGCQPEELHFLDVAVARQNPFEVVELSTFRSPPGVEAKRCGG